MGAVEVAAGGLASDALPPHPVRRTIDVAAAAAVARMAVVRRRMGARCVGSAGQQPVLVTVPLGKVVRRKIVFLRYTTVRFASERFASVRFARVRSASVRSAPVRSARVKFAPVRPARVRFAPAMTALTRLTIPALKVPTPQSANRGCQ